MNVKADGIEVRVTDLVAWGLPWLVPVPTAFIIGRAAVVHLEFPLLVAMIVGLGVEGMGFVTSNTALQLRQYNQSKRKIDPTAPFGLAAVLVLAYVAVAILMTVALDISQALQAYAGAIFPLLSLTAMVSAALRFDHKKRLQAIQEEKANRPKRGPSKPSNLDTPVKSVKNGRQKLDALLDAYLDNPNLTPSQAARAVGVSRQTVYNYLAKLEQSGRIRKNGQGVEVVS